jgi:hypothetical protein
MPALLKSHGPNVWDNRTRPRRIAEPAWLDERDGRNEVEIQSVRVAPFSQVSRFTWHSPWLLANFPSILLEIPTAFDRLEQRHFVGILDIHPDRNAIGDT